MQPLILGRGDGDANRSFMEGLCVTSVHLLKLRIGYVRIFQKVAAKKNESLQIIDMFNLFSLNSLVKETALGIRSPNATIPPVVSSMTDDIKPSVRTYSLSQ